MKTVKLPYPMTFQELLRASVQPVKPKSRKKSKPKAQPVHQKK